MGVKVKQRIPTTTYGFVELEMEYPTAEEAILDHDRLESLYNDNAGLSVNDWAKVRNKMLETGQFDPNRFPELSKAQAFWINETKKALRSLEAKEPVIK